MQQSAVRNIYLPLRYVFMKATAGQRAPRQGDPDSLLWWRLRHQTIGRIPMEPCNELHLEISVTITEFPRQGRNINFDCRGQDGKGSPLRLQYAILNFQFLIFNLVIGAFGIRRETAGGKFPVPEMVLQAFAAGALSRAGLVAAVAVLFVPVQIAVHKKYASRTGTSSLNFPNHMPARTSQS
jgi:hypothetical protein